MENMKVKDLREIAKELNIKGAYGMRKQDLIKSILVAQQQAKRRYQDSVQIGTIVAFTINENVMFSGKIVEIHANNFRIETKNGVKYLVEKRSVKWYKTGSRWPKGIYQELIKEKGEKHAAN